MFLKALFSSFLIITVYTIIFHFIVNRLHMLVALSVTNDLMVQVNSVIIRCQFTKDLFFGEKCDKQFNEAVTLRHHKVLVHEELIFCEKCDLMNLMKQLH